jgi:hypothetical protein
MAVAICALSAVWGAIVVALGTNHAARDIGWVATAWGGAASWLEGFRSLRKTPAQIHQDARHGRLYRSPLSRTIASGSGLLFLLALVYFFS